MRLLSAFPMAPLNPQAAEFTPVSASLPPPDHLLPALLPSSTPPCCLPLLPCVESFSPPPSHLPFMEFCPPPQFSIYNNSLNVYYAGGFLWPSPDPLLKNPFPDPSWHFFSSSSAAAAPAAREPFPLSLLPQPDDQASVVEGEKSSAREGEAEEVAASSRRRSTGAVHVGHRAGGRKTRRSSTQNHWRKMERFQSPEQGKGMPRRWKPRRPSGESCKSDQEGEEEPKHTTLMIRNIPNKFT